MMTCKHNSLKADLKNQFDQSQEIKTLVDYAPGGIVSRPVLEGPSGTVTLFAFDAGQRLSEHQAPYDALVQVIEGVAELTINGAGHQVLAGQLMLMPANIPHAVYATERFIMILTMMKS